MCMPFFELDEFVNKQISEGIDVRRNGCILDLFKDWGGYRKLYNDLIGFLRSKCIEEINEIGKETGGISCPICGGQLNYFSNLASIKLICKLECTKCRFLNWMCY